MARRNRRAGQELCDDFKTKQLKRFQQEIHREQEMKRRTANG